MRLAAREVGGQRAPPVFEHHADSEQRVRRRARRAKLLELIRGMTVSVLEVITL